MTDTFVPRIGIYATERGFTLIELLVTITLLAILASVAVPSFQSLLRDANQRALAQSFVESITLGRTEALTRGRSIALCASADGFSCDGSEPPDWSRGLLLQTAIGNQVINYWQGYDDTAVTFSGLDDQFLFDTSGMLGGSGSVVVCDARGAAEASAVIVTAAGLAHLATDSDGDSVVENHLGDDVEC